MSVIANSWLNVIK